MQPFSKHTGVAVPLLKDDINTDQVAPVQAMRALKPDYKALLFMRAKQRDDGSEDPDFVLNKPQFRNPGILVTGNNFGAGSSRVKREAEAKGLDRVFREAGFSWGESGCSMCAGGNGDRGEPGDRIVSTTNRNFENRQGPKVRTHLVSPATAAASAIEGRIADVRKL